jgi:uncharacterized integral membrane protein
MIYLLTAIGLTPGGSSTVHIYTQTIHRTTQLTTSVGRLSGIRIQSGHTKINEYTEKVKVKVKFALEQATKAQRGTRCIALLFPHPRRYMGVGG